MNVENPVIKLIVDNKKGLKEFSDIIDKDYKLKEKDLIRNYPTVYIHNWQNKDKYEVYVGESNDFFKRTEQHYETARDKDKWQHNLIKKDALLYVIAHQDFNKSMTLDVENKLIHYLSSSDNVLKVHNARGNPQNKYFPCEEFNDVFSKIWKKLRSYNKDLFLDENKIKDSAIYKASPLHKLNPEQIRAKELIMQKTLLCMLKNDEHQLVLVEGKAGTGKTVLVSSIFYELLNNYKQIIEEEAKLKQEIDTAIIVNHDEQLVVYEEIIKKLDIGKKGEQIVFNPTVFINQFKRKNNSSPKRKKIYDVVFVDEAHLLLTRNNQAFSYGNQLKEIIKYAKVVVVIFHKRQVLNAEQYIDDEEINYYRNLAEKNGSYIKLTNQMRINANEDILNWLDDFCENGIINKLPKNKGKYDIKLFNTPLKLEKAIKTKANNKKTMLSRIVATYDWPYSGTSTPKNEKYWSVKIGNWSKPWNREILRHGNVEQKKLAKGLSWAEQPQTIDEVGSTYTIQGFDLNYVGVILGPSIKYREGKVVIDKSASYNTRATQKRKLSDGTSKDFADEFINNELGVLLTRGVNGLYIYACDDELREHLKKMCR